jgi:hypothetical protein
MHISIPDKKTNKQTNFTMVKRYETEKYFLFLSLSRERNDKCIEKKQGRDVLENRNFWLFLLFLSIHHRFLFELIL